MATSAAVKTSIIKTRKSDDEAVRSKVSSSSATAMSLPCPSNAVRACVAGTKYGVGKLRSSLHLQDSALVSVQ